MAEAEHDLTKFIRTVQDFPTQGIEFKDISPLLADVHACMAAHAWRRRCPTMWLGLGCGLRVRVELAQCGGPEITCGMVRRQYVVLCISLRHVS